MGDRHTTKMKQAKQEKRRGYQTNRKGKVKKNSGEQNVSQKSESWERKERCV
jgi:hypothetical protein